MSISENLKVLNEKIQDAAIRSGRKREDITLVAVSKLMEIQKISEAIESGQIIFGENWVQELCAKMGVFGDLPKWHLIGHLQTNKVKYVVGKVELIQSVDSLRLAEAIGKCAVNRGVVQNVLLEVNAGEEESKFGLTLEETPYIIDKIKDIAGVRVRGLMTVAPFCDDPEEVRPVFQKMHALYQSLKDEGYPLDILSMGMSGDFETAIEEGSTMIRVGSAIFGKRNYKK